MNLLGKKLSFGAMIVALMLFISCEETGEFGLGDDDISPVDFFSENIAVSSAVVLIDSIPSSDTETLLVGQHTNSDFGVTEARGFSKLNLNIEGLVDLLDDVVLDSVHMNFKFNYIHNPEKNVLDLRIGRVGVGSIFDSLTYYTTSEQPNLAVSLLDGSILELGSEIFEITNLDSTYTLDVNPSWAVPFFDLLRNGDARVADQTAFETFLGGLAFVPGDFTTGMFGIETLQQADGVTPAVANMVFYFHQSSPNGVGITNFEWVLTFNDAKHFYSLTTDRSAAATAVVQNSGTAYEPSSGLRYIQEGNALVTKLDISAFQDFVDNNPEVIINFAELTIGPVEDRPADNGAPPQELLLYITDDRNTLIRDGINVFRGIQRDGANQIASSATITLPYDDDTKTYSTSITSFIQSYHADIFSRDELILFTENMNSSINGTVFSPENIELKIFYSRLK